MKNKQEGFILPLVLIIIAALVLGGGIYIYSRNKQNSKVTESFSASSTITNSTNETTPSTTPAILSYKIVSPYVYIYGKELSGVKIYDWSTGTEVTESSPLATATLRSTASDGTQTWIWDASKNAFEGIILATSIDMQGYDSNAHLVGRLSFGNGATDLNNLLFPQASDGSVPAQNWKDMVTAQFQGLTDWTTENLTGWRLNGTLDANVIAQLPKGSVLGFSKVFNTSGYENPDQGRIDEQNLEAKVRAVLADNAWKLTAGPTEGGFYQDYLYIKEGHPLILHTGTRDAVTGGMYVSVEFQTH